MKFLFLCVLCAPAVIFAAEQPIPFSHKLHVRLGAKCLDCHPIKGQGFSAGFPAEATCMACHVAIKTESPAIQKLAEHHKAKRPLRWVQIYKVPQYVWFSHQSHHKEAGVSCETCHGPIGEREVLAKEMPTSMASCMDCHTKHKAPNECNFCHEPEP